MPEITHAVVLAGSPESNLALYHRIRFSVGDPTASIDLVKQDGSSKRILMIRDIEMDRARKHARVDEVVCPAEHHPSDVNRGDREIETAQSVAQCLIDHGVERVVTDRSLPKIYDHWIQKRGIAVTCDPNLGILDRRSKDPEELHALREAQALTERCMEMVCTTIARASANRGGELEDSDGLITSERMFAQINAFFLQHGAVTHHGSIVASGIVSGDCHDRGRGPIRTGEPVIVDLFPQVQSTKYHGDCTRCVVHGEVPDQVASMHAAVVEAQQAAIDAVQTGVAAHDVNEAALSVIHKYGYASGIQENPETVSMVHGTGHGIGLDVHEPPLIDKDGVELVRGDVLTIEPGLYGSAIGGIRIEDMIAVTDDGCENFNTLHKGLDWTDR